MSGALFTPVAAFLSSAKIDPRRELSSYEALRWEKKHSFSLGGDLWGDSRPYLVKMTNILSFQQKYFIVYVSLQMFLQKLY